MSNKSAEELLEMYYLDIRSYLLEAAAAFDRIQRSKGYEKLLNDTRLKNLHVAVDILKSAKGDRAEQFLNLFSVK